MESGQTEREFIKSSIYITDTELFRVSMLWQPPLNNLICTPLTVSYIKGTNDCRRAPGESMLTFLKDDYVIRQERFDVLKKGLRRKITTALAILRSGCTTVGWEGNRKKNKGRWVKRDHHQSFHHLWTTGFSMRLGANLPMTWTCFRVGGCCPCCRGGRTVGWEVELLIKRPG